MKLDRAGLIGIIMIFMGLLFLKVGVLDKILMVVLWPLLSGSSDGKAVLLFVLMGSLLVVNSILTTSKIKNSRLIRNLDERKYLKWTITVILLTYIAGIIIELWLRVSYGVSPFTTFLAVNNGESSTSITHTHVFKSVIGYTISILGIKVPSYIHTGVSLVPFVYPLPLLIVVTFPLVYILGALSLNSRRDMHKLIIVFALTLCLISMVDGGMFSQPGVIGLAGLLVVYFAKKPFSLKNLVKPACIMLLIIFAGFAVEFAGSNTQYHDVTVVEQTAPIDLTGYNATITESTDSKTVYRIHSNMTDKEIFSGFSDKLKDRCGGFFVSWNIFSYL